MRVLIRGITGHGGDQTDKVGDFIMLVGRGLAMNEHDGNVAFKCTYNDGGDRGFVGFGGTCTDGNIIRNVEKKPRPWCSNSSNACYKYCNKGFRGKRPIHPCYESQIDEHWEFGPGAYHSRKRDGKPISMVYAEPRKIALLTTRHPKHDTEEERIVFGAYKIIKVSKDDRGLVWAKGNADQAILLSKNTALEPRLRYWNFKKPPSEGNPAWRTGLFRYISDQEVTNFLHALLPYLQSPRDRKVLEGLLDCCGSLTPEAAAEEVDSGVSKFDLRKKYGPGGEGELHRKLKQFIADHPERLGLGQGKSTVEHSFRTGDRVDVSIELASGKQCVVEVEVEGQSTLTGAHQALKYRALRAGQLDTTTLPHAFLVAYSIPKNVKKFCKRHQVNALEIDSNEIS